MSPNKTQPQPQSPDELIAQVEPLKRRKDAEVLLELFQEVTGYEAVMWGSSIIGFGRYHYVYKSGREGDFLATGFSPRKAAMSIYIMPGYQDYSELLSRLGKHKTGKSCLYITSLEHVDLEVLAELIRTGLRDLGKIWPVHAQ